MVCLATNPDYFTETGSVRCNFDNNTYDEEVINPCGRASWRTGGALTWTQTGNFRCVGGFVHVEERSAPCGELRWSDQNDSVPVTWTDTGSTRCTATTYEREQRDNCGNLQWTATSPVVWDATGLYDCRSNVTFQQESNQCGDTRWIDTGEVCGDSTHTMISLTATSVNVIEGQTACWNIVLDNPVFGSPLDIQFDLSGADQARNSYATPQTVTFLPGTSSGQLCIATTDDAVVDGVEPLCVTPRVSARLTSVAGMSCINVSDNDEATYEVTSITQTTPNPITEGQTVCWSVVVDRPVATTALQLAVMWGGADHVRNTYPNSTVTIPVGATSGNLCIQTADDTAVDGTEALCIAGFVANPRLGAVPGGLPCVNVLDNDGVAGGSTHTITSITPVTNPITEGDQACWTVTLDAAVATADLSINFTLSGADQTRNSYSNPSLTIPIGSSTGNVCVATTDDTAVDGTEQLCIVANTSARVTAVPAVSCIDVQDNDVAASVHTVVSVTPVASNITEGEQACWVVTLNTNVTTAALPITLNLTGSEQTAHGYAAPTGSIAVGSNNTTICVTTTDDAVVDGTTQLCATVATSARITAVPAASCIDVADNDTTGSVTPFGFASPIHLVASGGTHDVSTRLNLTINPDGTWALERIRTGNGTHSQPTPPVAGNWFAPTTPGVGAGYELEIVNNGVVIDQSGYDGTVFEVTPGEATPSTGGYIPLSVARVVTAYTGHMTDGTSDHGIIYVTGSFTLHIRPVGGGTVTTSTMTIDIQAESL